MISKRTLLLSLAAYAPLLLPGCRSASGAATTGETEFLRISRIIAGAGDLTPGAAKRIATLLGERDRRFADRLAGLGRALTAGRPRDEALSSLKGDDIAFALEIAKPWYLGYVGEPSPGVLKDDSAFATYLEAQAYAKIADAVPLPTYPVGPAGWWADPPKGVEATDLPADSASWDHQPRQIYKIAAPDPAWRAYAAGEYATMAQARAALGGSSGAVPQTHAGAD